MTATNSSSLIFLVTFEKNRKTIKTPKGDFKTMFKYYPVYNFDYTNPPTGNDINECMSELLFF